MAIQVRHRFRRHGLRHELMLRRKPRWICSLRDGRLVQDGYLSGHEPVLATLFVVVPLNIEFTESAGDKIHSLKLWKQTVTMHEKITGKSVAIDEAPRTLKRPDVAVQTSPDPIAGAQKSACGYLLGNSTAPIVQGNVEFNCLALSERWLAVL